MLFLLWPSSSLVDGKVMESKSHAIVYLNFSQSCWLPYAFTHKNVFWNNILNVSHYPSLGFLFVTSNPLLQSNVAFKHYWIFLYVVSSTGKEKIKQQTTQPPFWFCTSYGSPQASYISLLHQAFSRLSLEPPPHLNFPSSTRTARFHGSAQSHVFLCSLNQVRVGRCKTKQTSGG